MRRVVWTLAAQRDLLHVQEYISQFNPLAAQRMAARLLAVAQSLTENPNRGRAIYGGRRELTVVWPYIVRYRIEGEIVAILRIRHGAQQPD